MPHLSSITMFLISCILLLTLSALQPQSNTAQALQDELDFPHYDTVNQMFKRAAASPGEGEVAGTAEEEMSGSGSGSGSGDMMYCDDGLAPFGKSSIFSQ